MAWNYIKTWFMLEFISTLPYDLFVFHPIWEHAVLRLPRLLRLLKTQYYFSIWEQRAKIPVIISLIKLLVCFPYLWNISSLLTSPPPNPKIFRQSF